ncbi:MAG: DinB family protein [Gemmatimonadales bacterium]
MVRFLSISAALALTATAVSAQTPPAPQPTTIAVAIQRAYATIKTNLTQAAERMPEADYGFKPSSMPEMRVYGALFSHIAQSQFGTCSTVNGVANPMQGRQLETELTTKAQIVAALAQSFALCDTAYGSLTDANSSELITGGRGGPTARAALLANNVTHDNEMAGTAYVYLRAKNIVPPSTENAAAARGGGAGGRGGPPGQ